MTLITTPLFTPLGSVRVVADNLERSLDDGHEFIAFSREQVQDMVRMLRAAESGMRALEADNAGLRGMARELAGSL